MRHFTDVQVDGAKRRAGRLRARQSRALLGTALLAALVLLAASATAAQAATPPKVSTKAAHEVSFGSAVLTGSVNPNGADTSYYFQYGIKKQTYGSQTAIADAGAGTKAVAVRLPISGLQPLTVYHYRLVAVNSVGTTFGDDEKLQTTKVPLSLQILASPNPVVFGGAVTVQGTLSGTNNANRQVVLQGNQFPFTAGFQNIGNKQLTGPTGSFSFPILGLGVTTQFRVATSTNPPVISPTAVESVAVRVSSHVARTKRRGFARIYGTVTPAEDGQQVGMLRITHGHGALVGGTVLRHRDASSSKFSRVVRVKRGVYRVLVRVVNGGQASNYGTPLLIR
jgi:hypothetical protein